ncbi:MAG: proton-conducting transporter membrane subunit [Leeuwenhoekiella sp.]
MIGIDHNSSETSQKPPLLRSSQGHSFAKWGPKFFNILLWALFGANVIYLILNLTELPQHNNGLLRFDGFTLLIWLTVTFFSAIISSYAKNYLTGFKYQKDFYGFSFGFTISVMLMVAAEHVLLLIASWFLMGLFMSRLIRVDRKWEEARQAGNFALRFFTAGSLCLGIGLTVLAYCTGSFSLSQIFQNLESLSDPLLLIVALFIITAAVIQSAIYPFHRWLLSAMTAPTPASALMHAGFVNGAGILLTLFATLIVATDTFSILFIIGGLTAIIAQFTKLLQANVKQKLACSTIAQMGFMIMQCGLGFFNAAVAHLILHGFYKAYLFLSAGEEIKFAKPSVHSKLKIKPLQALIVLIFSISGAGLFSILTGKGTSVDSGIFLTLIVAITVGQATYNIVKEQSLPRVKRLLVSAALFMVGIGLYALAYNGVTFMMGGLPYAIHPLPLTPLQVIFGFVFLLGFFLMKLGTYKKLPWLYVKLLNASQPAKKSVLFYKTKSL